MNKKGRKEVARYSSVIINYQQTVAVCTNLQLSRVIIANLQLITSIIKETELEQRFVSSAEYRDDGILILPSIRAVRYRRLAKVRGYLGTYPKSRKATSLRSNQRRNKDVSKAVRSRSRNINFFARFLNGNRLLSCVLSRRSLNFFPHPRVYSRSNETQPTKRVSDLMSDLISRETRRWSCTECGKIDFQSWKNRRARDTFAERANGISRIASKKQRASIVEKKDFTRIIKARNVRKKKENEGKKRTRKEKKRRREERRRTNERTKMCPIDADVSRNGKSRTTTIVVERDNSKLPGDALYRRCKGRTDTNARSYRRKCLRSSQNREQFSQEERLSISRYQQYTRFI